MKPVEKTVKERLHITKQAVVWGENTTNFQKPSSVESKEIASSFHFPLTCPFLGHNQKPESNGVP